MTLVYSIIFHNLLTKKKNLSIGFYTFLRENSNRVSSFYSVVTRLDNPEFKRVVTPYFKEKRAETGNLFRSGVG